MDWVTILVVLLANLHKFHNIYADAARKIIYYTNYHDFTINYRMNYSLQFVFSFGGKTQNCTGKSTKIDMDCTLLSSKQL